MLEGFFVYTYQKNIFKASFHKNYRFNLLRHLISFFGFLKKTYFIEINPVATKMYPNRRNNVFASNDKKNGFAICIRFIYGLWQS